MKFQCINHDEYKMHGNAKGQETSYPTEVNIIEP